MNIKYFKNNEVVTEPLPTWLNEELYKARNGKYIIIWSLGFPTDIPCGRILQYSSEQIYILSDLLNTNNFKSSYRKSLRNQLDNWLDDEESSFTTPFSEKQWSTLSNPYTKRNTLRVVQTLHKLAQAKMI